MDNTDLKPKKKLGCCAIFLIIIGVIFITILISMNSGGSNNKSTNNQENDSTSSATTPDTSEKDHQEQLKLASTVNYKIIERLVNDSPLKTQVEIRIVVTGKYSSNTLLSLLKTMYDSESTQGGYQYRDTPNSIYIWAYTSTKKAKDGSSCIAMLQKNTGDSEPNLSVDEEQLHHK